jgi:dGTPase
LPGANKNFRKRNSSLEAQVANLSDEITYYSHDLDDGLESGLLSEKKLARDVKLWGQAARAVKRQYGELPDECRRYFTIRWLIDWQVTDVVETTEQRILDAAVNHADEVRDQKEALVNYSLRRHELNLELREYLYQNLYYNPVVHDPNRRAVRMLEELFHYYINHPKELGPNSRKRARKCGIHRAVCDYLAGMTDRYTIGEYHRLFEVGI